MVFPLKMMVFPLKMMVFPLNMMVFPLKMMVFPLKMMGFPIKNDGFPIKNDGFPIKHDGFPVKHDGFPIKNDGFPIKNDGFPIKHDGFPIKNDGFPIKNDGFPIKNDGFPIKNDGFPIKNDGFPIKNDGFSLIGPSLCEISLAPRNWAVYCTSTVRRIGKGNSSTQNACWISPLGLLVPLFWHAHAASQQHGEAWSPLTIGSVCLFPCPPCSLAAAWNCHPLIKHGNGKSTIFIDGFPKNPSVCIWYIIYMWFSWIFHCHVWLPEGISHQLPLFVGQIPIQRP